MRIFFNFLEIVGCNKIAVLISEILEDVVFCLEAFMSTSFIFFGAISYFLDEGRIMGCSNLFILLILFKELVGLDIDGGYGGTFEFVSSIDFSDISEA